MLAIVLVSAIAVVSDPAPSIADPSGEWKYTYDVAGSDSFSSKELSKWNQELGDWKGTPPGAFKDENAQVSGDAVSPGLDLFTRQETGFSPEGIADQCECGFDGITTPILVSKTAFKFGFFEISAKFAASSIQTSFWLQGFVGEINVVDAVTASSEQDGGASLKSDYHCFDAETDGQNTESDSKSLMDSLPDDFDPTAQHTYGIDWSADGVVYYVDGVPVRTLEASGVQTQGCINDEMNVILSMETIEVHGIPTEAELKSTVAYFRHWTRAEATTTTTPAPTTITSTSTSTSTTENKLPCTAQFRGPIPETQGVRTRYARVADVGSAVDCAYQCETRPKTATGQTDVPCGSFSYRAFVKQCWLFTMTGIPEMGADIKTSKNNFDHYYMDPTCPTSGVTTLLPTTVPELPCVAQYRGPVVGTKSTSRKHKMGMVIADSIAECAWQCDAKVDDAGGVCKEFSYMVSKKKCFMFKEGTNQKADARFDHYYTDETCPEGSITTLQPTTKGIHEEAVEGSACADPTWTLAEAGTLKHKVCSSPFTKVDTSGAYTECDKAQRFSAASARCAAKGGRVCSTFELKKKVGKQTPDTCSINSKFVWTSDECTVEVGVMGHMVVKASAGKKGVCKSDKAKAKTMCCGDNEAPEEEFEVGAMANGGAEGSFASAAAGGDNAEDGSGAKGGVVAAGVLACVLGLLVAGIVLRSRTQSSEETQHKPNSDDIEAAAAGAFENPQYGAGGNEPPVNSEPKMQEDVGGSTASSFAFVSALDKERRKSTGAAAAPATPGATPERRGSFAEAAEAEATFLRSGMVPVVGTDELTRLHTLSTANVRDAVQLRPKKAAAGPSIAEDEAMPPAPPADGAEDAFDAAMLQLNEHGNGIRVQSTRRGNPLYRGSVYEESDKIGISEL